MRTGADRGGKVEEVVAAERKGCGGGNAGSKSIWGLLGSASSLTGKPVWVCVLLLEIPAWGSCDPAV